MVMQSSNSFLLTSYPLYRRSTFVGRTPKTSLKWNQQCYWISETLYGVKETKHKRIYFYDSINITFSEQQTSRLRKKSSQ
jgi:hypothetical protein